VQPPQRSSLLNEGSKLGQPYQLSQPGLGLSGPTERLLCRLPGALCCSIRLV
jgi:hypothetical protein